MSRTTALLAVLTLMAAGVGSATAAPPDGTVAADGTGVITFESGTVAVPAAPTSNVVDHTSTPIDINGQLASEGTQESPEPATVILLGLGGFGAWWHARRLKAGTVAQATH
jgi:hypothetical protein